MTFGTDNPGCPVTVECQDIDVDVSSGSEMIAAGDIDNGSTDNCDVTLSIDESDFDDVGIPRSVTLTATDPSGNIGTCKAIATTIVNPAASFVTGGGWIESPEGAYPSETLATGKASFEFVSKYKKGKSIPSG
jgi:hypothetical protein